MQWDASPNSGFTKAKEPWLPVADDYRTANVAVQAEDPKSILTLYHRLIELRRSEPALAVGSYRSVPAEGDILAYKREHDATRFIVALNMGGTEAGLELGSETGNVVLTTYQDREGKSVSGTLRLRANEGIIARLAG
jgi:alpha-glucosidase